MLDGECHAEASVELNPPQGERRFERLGILAWGGSTCRASRRSRAAPCACSSASSKKLSASLAKTSALAARWAAELAAGCTTDSRAPGMVAGEQGAERATARPE